eukprot:XP_001709109.1 Hypothetical protein GL50803_39017 [Giardia lamblia ATCC 50803]
MMRSTRQSRASWRPRHWSSSRPSRLRSTDCTWVVSAWHTWRCRLMGTAVSLDITSTLTVDGLCQASVPRPEELRRGLPLIAPRCTPGLGPSGP